MHPISRYFHSLLDFVYPESCIGCGRELRLSEKDFCHWCNGRLPHTGYFSKTDNSVVQRFWGREEVAFAAALFFFRKGNIIQSLMHQLKYRNNTAVGVALGEMIGKEIKSDTSCYPDLDAVIPLPLHWKKEQKRGYNQATYIAQGVSNVLQIPMIDKCIFRIRENVTQTRQTRYQRWGNVEDLFAVKNPNKIAGKSLLLVDDVITTGSTLESCIQVIRQHGCKSVSVATIATVH